MSFIATIASVVGIAGGIHALTSSNSAPQVAQQAAGAAMPAASQYPVYQQLLSSMFPTLSNLDPTQAVKNNPYYNFLLQQATGPGGSIPAANKATFGSSRNGALPLDVANYSANLAGQFGNQQIQNQFGLLGILATLGGFNMGNPGAAAGAITGGFTNQQSLINGGVQGILGSLASLNKGSNPNLNPVTTTQEQNPQQFNGPT